LLQLPSVEAAETFADGSLDFVWIDACHWYAQIREDISAWVPKVKPGGVVGGDDFSQDLFPSVVRAVQEAFPAQIVHTRGVSWWTEVPK
jgi:predicted O-methyltransferase YrrM